MTMRELKDKIRDLELRVEMSGDDEGQTGEVIDIENTTHLSGSESPSGD